MIPDLLAATLRLAGALAAENAALRAMDLATAAALLPDKEVAAAGFEAARKAVPVPPPPGLKDAAARLVTEADENRRLLERGLAAQKEVLGLLARAARAAAPAPRYGRSGAYAPPPPTGWTLSARA